MKKICLFTTLVAILLLVTGCGSKNELVCSQSVSGVKVDMILNFKDDKVDAMGLKYTMDLSNYSDAQISAISAQNLCSTVQAAMGTYSSAFTNCKQKMENKDLIITADFDLAKIPGGTEVNSTRDEIVKSLESQGYKCGN